MCIYFWLMKKLLLSTLLIVFMGIQGSAQSVTIEEEYDRLTDSWLEVSDVLKSYQGLSDFCMEPKFRDYSVELLKQLHHYDSVVLDFLNDPTTAMIVGQKEYHKTLKDIEKFEAKYDIKSFIDFLRESCITRNGLEKNKQDLQMGQGADSYDGQVYILETDIAKFLKHIDKRIVSIDEHLHRIHPDKSQYEQRVTMNE